MPKDYRDFQLLKTKRHKRGSGRSPKTAKPLAETVLRHRQAFYATRELMGGEGSEGEDLNLPIKIEANTSKQRK